MPENWILLATISISANIVIAILGVVPSYFVTAFNINYFGFGMGLLISIIGESIGALVSFILYRKGFKKIANQKLENNYRMQKIINANNKEAMYLIATFRIFPYMPSGFVTMAAAIGKIPSHLFVIASTLGKIPSLVIESAIVYGVLKSENTLMLVVIFIILLIIYFIVSKVRKSKRKNESNT